MAGNRLLVFLLIIWAIQISILIFDKAEPDANQPLWLFFKAPQGWSETVVIAAFGIAAVAIAATVYAGAIIFKFDLPIFAPLFVAFLGLGIPLVSLWSIINRQAMFGTANWLIASLLVAPFMLMYAWFCISWWRGNSEL